MIQSFSLMPLLGSFMVAAAIRVVGVKVSQTTDCPPQRLRLGQALDDVVSHILNWIGL